MLKFLGVRNERAMKASIVTGKSLDSPEKGNVDKMSEKCRKNVRKMSRNCPEGLKTQFSDIFWTIFVYLVDALFGDPVQCSPVSTKLAL